MFLESGHDEFENMEMITALFISNTKTKWSLPSETEKDAPLALGMHMTNRSNSIVYVNTCKIIDEDYRKKYFQQHASISGIRIFRFTGF